MKNKLAASPLHIVDQFVPGARNSLTLRDLASPEDHLPYDDPVLFYQVIDASDVLPGHHQDMNGCLRSDVFKGYDGLVPIDEISRLFSLDDMTEHALIDHCFSPEHKKFGKRAG